MPTMTAHTPGTINWPELGTTDQDGAKKFYTALFGWKHNDNDMGEQGTYTIFTRDGVDVAALFTLQPDMLKQGVPPNWATYITVESADAAAEKAKALGGTIMMGPFDVMDHGRMAVIRDPQGAVFAVWQAKKHIGVGVLGEPNSLGWTQLNAKDTAKAKAFYTALIGWKAQDDPMGPEFGGGHYTTFMKSDGPAGGMMAMPPMPGSEHIPSHWLPYFAVSDVDAMSAKAGSLGGKTHVPPTDIPDVGRFSVLADPQGAAFALIKFLPRG